MDNKNKITFFCVQRNGGDQLFKLIEYVAPYIAGCFVVDQMSTDGTYERLRAGRGDGILSIRRPVAFMADPDRNLGNSATGTDWILTFDPDERPTEDFLKDMSNIIDEDEFDIVFLRCFHYVDGVKLNDGGMVYLPRFYKRGMLEYSNTPHTFPSMRPRVGEQAPRILIMDENKYYFKHCRLFDEMVKSNRARDVYGEQTKAMQNHFIVDAQNQIATFTGERDTYTIAVAKGEA